MRVKKRLILAGGGDAQDSRPLDELFAAWMGPHGKMLYLPVALEGSGRSYKTCLPWLQSVFASLGVLKIEMWTDLGEHDTDELARFDSVYLGGGNTFRLLAQLQESGFDAALVQFAHQGGAIYGGSAGAIVLGRDIMTCAHLDRNDVGLHETQGLDLVAGHVVLCHYQPKDDARILEYVRRGDSLPWRCRSGRASRFRQGSSRRLDSNPRTGSMSMASTSFICP